MDIWSRKIVRYQDACYNGAVKCEERGLKVIGEWHVHVVDNIIYADFLPKLPEFPYRKNMFLITHK